jgi:hypothetical protein
LDEWSQRRFDPMIWRNKQSIDLLPAHVGDQKRPFAVGIKRRDGAWFFEVRKLAGFVG